MQMIGRIAYLVSKSDLLTEAGSETVLGGRQDGGPRPGGHCALHDV
jgi:hypothetical protein